MAVSIATTFSQLYMSASLPDVVTINNQDEEGSATVTVEVDSMVAFTSVMYAHGHAIELYDIRSIIEQVMRTNNLNCALCDVTATAEGDTVAAGGFTVVLSDYDIASPEVWLQQHFLSTRSMFLIGPDETQLLSWYQATGEQITKQIVALVETEGGEQQTLMWSQGQTTTATQDVDSYLVNVADVMDHFSTSGTVKAFTVYRGADRGMTFYIADSHNLHFRFRNAFDVTEYVNIFGVTTKKQSLDASEGVVLRSTVKYDRNIETEYEVESNIISPEEGKWLGQFITSPYVEVLCADGQWREILVDGDSETSDSDEESVRIKFKWSFAKNIQHI